MISLLSILHCLIIKKKKHLLNYLNKLLTEMAHLLDVLLLNNLKDSTWDHVRDFLTISIFFWIIYSYDLAKKCIDKS